MAVPAPSARPVASSGSTAASIDPNTMNSTISAASTPNPTLEMFVLRLCSATWPPTATSTPAPAPAFAVLTNFVAWLTVNFEACLDIVTIANAT